MYSPELKAQVLSGACADMVPNTHQHQQPARQAPPDVPPSPAAAHPSSKPPKRTGLRRKEGEDQHGRGLWEPEERGRAAAAVALNGSGK